MKRRKKARITDELSYSRLSPTEAYWLCHNSGERLAKVVGLFAAMAPDSSALADLRLVLDAMSRIEGHFRRVLDGKKA